MDIFVQATRMKLRFSTPAGLMTTEDLWDLPLQKGKVNLDALAVGISNEMASTSTSFVNKTARKNETLDIKLQIILHIIQTRMEEAEQNEKREVRAQEKARILEIIARKEDANLEGKSLEELKGLLANL